ncbi:hypothetical protein [Salinarimonas rosea]|uniref:hypothetical protein n=1 Tax=Salinarimonas rosea TaxID=552063 RepID=UPI0012EB2F68|nr:hypothetical protein [Salinarimonas rosea]
MEGERKRHSLNRRMREKAQDLIDAAYKAKRVGDLKEKQRCDLKRRVLYDAMVRRKEPEIIGMPSVFISFSQSGFNYFKRAEALCKNRGFEVKTGFDNQRNRTVLKSVKASIRTSTLFLGIMTPCRDSNKPVDLQRQVPSVWLPEEKGMALILEKPFRLLVHEDVHPDFWKQTTPEQLHTIFADGEFEDKLQEAIGALEQRYQELLEIELQNIAKRFIDE